MISTEEVMNIKAVELIKIYNFYFDYFFIQQSGSKHCSQMTYLLYSFHKLCERFMNLSTMCTTTLSDEEMIKIKVVDLDELYNFVDDDFFSWNHLLFQNLV